MKTCSSCQNNKDFNDFYKESRGRGYRAECKECFKTRMANNRPLYKKWRPVFTDEQRAKHRENQRKWRQANPQKKNAQGASRRAAKIGATPVWLTAEQRQQITEMYNTAPPGYHVDHIVPLKGKTVCGLHVPWNLQHLPACENMSKNNRLVG